MKCKRSRSNKSNSIDTLIRFLKYRIGALSTQLVYAALLLFYAYQRPDTPRWAKNIILGSIAYLLSPFDSIPDLTPVLGFTDDFGVLSFGLVSIACYIDDEVRLAAKAQINTWFDRVSEEDLLEVDRRV